MIMKFKIPKLFGKKKEEEFAPMDQSLPEDLERFRMREPAPPMPGESMMAREGPASERPIERMAPTPPAAERYPTVESLEPTPIPTVPPVTGPAMPERPEPKPEIGMSASQKLDMILQKLETINTRLKLLEERSK
jgi:hypothetical protein